MSEIDGGGVSRADGFADVRNPPFAATIRMVFSVGQAPEHRLAPRSADHQVRDGRLLRGQRIAKVFNATLKTKTKI